MDPHGRQKPRTGHSADTLLIASLEVLPLQRLERGRREISPLVCHYENERHSD
jgi:hypothetical protein